MGQAHRLGRRRREATLIRTGQGLGRRRAGRQGGEGRSHGSDGIIHRHIADHEDVDRTGRQTLDNALLQLVQGEGGDLCSRRHGFALVAAGQQAGRLNAEGAARRGQLLGQDLREEGLDLLERRGAKAGIGQIGGQNLHLQLQIGRTGRARQLIGVAVYGEAGAVDLARQDAAQLVGGQLAQAALGEDHGGQHLRGEAVGGQAFLADARADRDQDLLVLEGRGLDRQAHAVGEVDDRGADGGDLGTAGGRRGGAEVGVRPLQFSLFGAGCDGD
ncbi:hypothetical protein D3C80_701010 [compost metagenome]